MKFSPKAEVVRFAGEDVIATSGPIAFNANYVTTGKELNQWSGDTSYTEGAFYGFKADGSLNPTDISVEAADAHMSDWSYAWYNNTNDYSTGKAKTWYTANGKNGEVWGANYYYNETSKTYKLPAGYDKQF